ncbi:GNAT family N-acetyltransferase [Lentzea flava]|uniref:N-acetyltransferase GCN5 n=1 Tax=Lentzea flava TaxID=103732 RepID=A0ABQ2UGZ6_9PSEU|nr:GNAT family N-acetyltransferase [Lentzea flava]MCP2200980.1 Acetyltransferase (GNAT) family protein [Lentzea flava]GGU27388.1 N-acetyltransferase GCN5 [Lentzea flava]
MTEQHTITELDDENTALAYEAMRELRPHLTSEDDFVSAVRVQRKEGYRLIASLDSAGRVAAVAGFRHMTNLYAGSHLYIDDVSTLPSARKQGHAGALLRWVDEEARRLDCAGVHLDSGTHRHDAHRLYLSSGYVIPALHFSKTF